MEQHIQQQKFALCAIKGIQEMEHCISGSKVERSLLDLVKLRTSQLNDCDQCKISHLHDARSSGETMERLFTLKNWREVTSFNERERAALEWTEAITLSGSKRIPDAVYQQVREQFEEQELVVLTMTINVINSWNNLSLALRNPEEMTAIRNDSNLSN